MKLLKKNDTTFLRVFACLMLLFLIGQTAVSQNYDFVDVADSMDINDPFNTSEGFGRGMSFYDYDQDGWDDLTFAKKNNAIKIYNNKKDSFEASTINTNNGLVKQPLWVDYDDDGDLDLFVTSRGGVNKLFENDGDFNFTDVTDSAGLKPIPSNTFGASFGDYNRDSYLDLYICNYENPLVGDTSDADRFNKLYKNNGDGTFTDVTQQANISDGVQPSFQSLWFDYNNDGLQDLYIINDRIYASNSLYRNNGDGTFTEVGGATGSKLDSIEAMSITAGDFDNDADLDIYVTNSDVNNPSKRAMFLVNNGDGTFQEQAVDYGVDLELWAWGAVWNDHNNNTYQDLFVATGRVGSLNAFYENNKGDSFSIPQNTVPSDPVRSYSVGKGDFNNDGLYDIGVHNIHHRPILWKNRNDTNNYIKITLEGTASNHFAIGSWIKVFVDTNQYTQYTFCGQNYLGQNSQHHIFGLGQYNEVDSLKVEYSLGHTDTYYNLNVNQHYYLKEGETWEVNLTPASDTIVMCEGDTATINAEANNAVEYEWNTGLESDSITITSAGQYWVEAKNTHSIESNSDTVYVKVLAPPQISHSITHPSCHGLNDGSVELQVGDQARDYQIDWGSEDTGSVINNLGSGSYDYQYTDDAGCNFKDTVELISPLPLNVQTQVKQNENRIEVAINGGTPPYQIYLNDTQVQKPITNVSPGNHQLKVVDNNGCKHTTNVQLKAQPTSFFENAQRANIDLIPNPITSTETLRLYSNQALQNLRVIILNQIGQKVYTNHFNKLTKGKHELGFRPNKSGLYLVKVRGRRVNADYKVIKME